MSHVTVHLGTNNAPLATGLASAKGLVEEFSHEAKHHLLEAFTFGAVIEGIESALEKAHELVKISERYGIGAENLQVYANAAKLTGAELGNLDVVFKKLVDSQQHALAGEKEQIKAFELIGLSVADLKNASVEQIFNKLADGIEETTDKAAAFSAMNTLAGKSSKELFNLLQKGSEGIKELGHEMDVWSASSVQELAEMKEKQVQLTEEFKVGFGNALIFVVGLWKSLVAAVQFFFVAAFGGFKALYTQVVEFAGGIIDSVQAVGFLLKALVELVSFDFSSAKKSWEGFYDGIDKGIRRTLGSTSVAVDQLGDVLKDAHDKYEEDWGEAWNPKSKSPGGTGYSGEESAAQLVAEEAAKKAKEDAKEIKKLQEEAAKAQHEAYLDSFDLQGKITALEKEQFQAKFRMNETTKEGLEYGKQFYESTAKLEKLRDEQAKKEEEHQKKIEGLNTRVAEAQREYDLSQLATKDAIKELEEEILRLRLEKPADEEKQLENKLEELRMEKELSALKKEDFKDQQAKLKDIGGKIKSGLSSPSDFLRSIGGGGNVNQNSLNSVQALIEEYRQQRSILQEIAKNTKRTGDLEPELSLR